jgi:mannonate dehydratase
MTLLERALTPQTVQARIGLGPVTRITDEVATIAHQLGAPYVVLWPSVWQEERPGSGLRWTVTELMDAKRRCAERGLVLEAIAPHNYVRAMLGLPGRDAQIEQCIETVRSMGRVEIHVLDDFWGSALGAQP